ncbi:unnamed protein product [Schistocephalus solidus]|uniref:Anaphase-promoting complex subunit 11 n=1 Tax=Schistocephalus solidus TaxID=70667 RepID=A0A3P7CZ01_SCHSO|nr:unnamed protein product [Schistocephalus solidus]
MPQRLSLTLPQLYSGTHTGLKIFLSLQINNWFGVGTWRWCTNDNTCGICRNTFETCCAECKLPGDDCPLVWGQCSHCFHMHCIINWLNTRQSGQLCPLCRQEWKFRQ